MYLTSTFVILSCILIFFFRKSFKSLIYKFFYGDYHIKYLSLLFSDNSYLDGNYYSKSDLYNQVSLIKNALNKQEKEFTEKPIFFQNIEFGIGTNKLISLLGKPISYEVLDINNRKVVSLEYYIQPNNVMDRYVFYFMDDSYYFGEFIFNKVTESISNQVLDKIKVMYDCGNVLENEMLIHNSKGNNLLYKDFGYRITVSYFNQDHYCIRELLQVQQEFRTKMKSSYVYQLDVQQLSF